MTETAPSPSSAPAPEETGRSPRFRWRAFGVHLAISLVILAALLYVLFAYWFPGYLFDTDGGWQALRIIAGIDIVLGPLLTLVVSHPGKPRAMLRKDYTVIGIVQVLALVAGTWIAWDSRPYAVIWYDDAFHSLPYGAFADEPAAHEWIAARGQAPLMLSAELPTDPFLRSEYLEAALKRKSSAMFDARLYRDWPGTPERIRAGAYWAQKSIDIDPGRKAAYEAELRRFGLAPADVLPVPVTSRYRKYFMLLDATTLATRGVAMVEPDTWFFTGLGELQTRKALRAATGAGPDDGR